MTSIHKYTYTTKHFFTKCTNEYQGKCTGVPDCVLADARTFFDGKPITVRNVGKFLIGYPEYNRYLSKAFYIHHRITDTQFDDIEYLVDRLLTDFDKEYRGGLIKQFLFGLLCRYGHPVDLDYF
jgi:hypothetical protein